MQRIDFTAYGAPVVGYLHEDHYRLAAHKIRPALIVCPGGGYYLISPREADDPAMEYFTLGYNVFILTYSILEKAPDFRPLLELAHTVATVREHSEAWHIDPDRIAVMGFSAGGHLVATLGTKWNDPAVALPRGCRPDALILCYPVITMGEFTHVQTRDNITGFLAATAVPCISCKYCLEECPIGVNVPAYFGLLNLYKTLGKKTNMYYERAIFGHAKASECLKCGKCEKICPQHIAIRQHLADFAALYE